MLQKISISNKMFFWTFY